MNLCILGMRQFNDNIGVEHVLALKYALIGFQFLEDRVDFFEGINPPCFGSPYLGCPLIKLGDLKGVKTTQMRFTAHLSTPKPLEFNLDHYGILSS